MPEILQELRPYTGRFPRRAVLSAIAQREAITPHLLQALEEVAQAPAEFARREDYMLQLFAAYLLAQFREKRAYRPLIQILRAPGEIPFDLFGDTVTERLNAILASVYDGDPTPLHQLVEDGEVNEYKPKPPAAHAGAISGWISRAKPRTMTPLAYCDRR